MKGFPWHREPDGNRFAPHHYYVGCTVVLLASVVSGIELGAAPTIALTGTLSGLFCFMFVWYDLGHYPVVGAAGALAGPFVVAVGLLTVDPMLLPHRLVAGVGVLVALDDALQHAFGAEMPLDRLWKAYLAPVLAE